jgi:very-short-patch-repair endonuclease
MWSILRGRQLEGFKFRRQFSIGQFIADFCCFERMVVIELDGGQHQDQVQEDNARSTYLENHGFRVVRFWNNEVLENSEGVALAILDALEERR